MIKHLAGKTIFISGASRGIGKAIAIRCAQDGANIIIGAKTADPHPKLPGTIYTAAKEIEDAGGKCLPCIVDVRDEGQLVKAMKDGAEKFGGIDILINNASAISLTGTLETDMKRYDLMNSVNARGTYVSSRTAIPYLLKSKNPHILNISPPLNMNPKWFENNTAYTIAKYGMSMCVLGMSREFAHEGLAVNALWPKTAIATAAIDLIATDMRKQSRTTDIMCDAAYLILTKDSKTFNGNFVVDEEIIRKETGLTNFDKYAVEPGNDLMLDFFLEDDSFTSSLESSKQEGSTTDVSVSMNALKAQLSADIVKQTNGVYLFKITDSNQTDWYLDLKNGEGSLSGSYDGKVNCTMTMTTEVFNSMIKGAIKPTTAFMSGQLKIKGDMGLAMKLEKLMKTMSKL